MENASAIERCIQAHEPDSDAVWVDAEVAKAARTELAELWNRLAELEGIDVACDAAIDHVLKLQAELAGYTETMACGHRKADWVEAEPFLTPEEGETHEAYCKACREIEQAVEREVAGMREAAKLIVTEETSDIAQQFDGLKYLPHTIYRLLDSSAARRGKQRIREEALVPIKQLAEKWLGWAGKPTQEAQGCGNTDDERNEAANDAYREAANSLLTLIDRPGGR